MKPIATEVLANVIDHLPERFDTHDVEQALIKHFPEEFACGLLAYKDSNYPLLVFSQQLALRVDREFADRLEQTTKVESYNLAGKKNENQQWRKLQ